MSWELVRDRIGLAFRPIERWPGKSTYDRETGPFKAGLRDTLAVLERELRNLSARDVLLEIAIPEGRWRQDGLPRSDARADHPGVILSFNSRHGPLRIWFDRFTEWRNNLRAIAMHLENLRHAGMYGVGSDGQQYSGWKAIPAEHTSNGFRTAADAAAWMASAAGIKNDFRTILNDQVFRTETYRMAAARLHPDNKATGSHDLFVQLQEAMRTIQGGK